MATITNLCKRERNTTTMRAASLRKQQGWRANRPSPLGTKGALIYHNGQAVVVSCALPGTFRACRHEIGADAPRTPHKTHGGKRYRLMLLAAVSIMMKKEA
ncbi:MAG: hypothetical protein FWH17_08270 [Oscillospiraceae bacterium]|nr:hypothetical protein [Oscillospiraceae bacterium]